MNGTMPATVNSSDGAGEISDALGTTVCPRWAKCSRKRRRISAVCMSYSVLRGNRPGAGRSGSVVGGGRAAVQRLGDASGGERGVEPGARTQLVLALGHRVAHVGTEVTDGVGEVAQCLGD